ncbi:DUF4012 domain-containing protein [Microbacterium sp. X-17]|uniref:DUF4012 domain-containing protein n=1 Tax=Microbacterium sp. X-17 TaxID=3144404 RepID=UPI0031F48E0D
MAAPPVTSSARRRTAGRVVAWVLGIGLVVAVLGAVWIGVSALLAFGHVRAAQNAAADVSLDMADIGKAAATLDRVAAETSAARALTSGPVWSAAAALPWVGPQLSAVTTTITSIDDVASDGVRPLVDAAENVSIASLRPHGGAFDLSAFATLHTAAAQSVADVDRADAAVQSIDTSVLLPALRAPITSAADFLDRTRSTVDGLAQATALLAPVLGGNGPRDYLVVFQNNAEWRSLGGIAGAMTVLHTDAGRITLGQQASGADFRRYSDPVLPLSDDLVQVFSRRPGLFMQNVTQVPDFPTTAALARAMWAGRTGQQVDGVISLDPVALSYILAATGPVKLPSGDTLTSANAVSLLLNEVYLRYPKPADQDAFFAAATVAVFNSLASGSADPGRLVKALAQADAESRVLMWSTHPDEQEIIEGTTLQGTLPATNGDRTTFGVYLNDGTGSKMDYYLRVASATTWCTDTEGSPDAALTVTLRNDAPADAASLPWYITGGGVYGVPDGSAKTVAYLFLPAGSSTVFTDSTGGGAGGFGSGTYEGHPVVTWTTQLAPGEQASATVRVRTPQTAELGAQMTPVIPQSQAAPFAAECSRKG